MKAVFAILMMTVLGAPAYSENRTATVDGINAFGLDFHRRLAKSGGNIVFSRSPIFRHSADKPVWRGRRGLAVFNCLQGKPAAVKMANP